MRRESTFSTRRARKGRRGSKKTILFLLTIESAFTLVMERVCSAVVFEYLL